MERDIAICFTLLVNYLKNRLGNINNYDCSKMTINEIKNEVNILLMKYIVDGFFDSGDTKLRTTMAFEHMNKLLEEHDVKFKYLEMEKENKNLKEKLTDIENKIKNNTNLNEQSKGWFY